MNIIKGLFFDLDGTLVDTLEADFRAYRQAAKETGRELTENMYNYIIGLRYDVFLKKLFPDITKREVEKIRQAKVKVYPDYLHLSRPNHQLIEFFKTIRPHHITVLITTAQKVNANAVLKVSKLENLFDHIITGDMVTNAKPHPEVYLKALELTGLKSNEVIVFEDSEPGIKAANAAGIATLKITITKQ